MHTTWKPSQSAPTWASPLAVVDTEQSQRPWGTSGWFALEIFRLSSFLSYFQTYFWPCALTDRSKHDRSHCELGHETVGQQLSCLPDGRGYRAMATSLGYIRCFLLHECQDAFNCSLAGASMNALVSCVMQQLLARWQKGQDIGDGPWIHEVFCCANARMY